MSSDKRWLDDEPPPTEEELRRAEAFGDSVDRIIAGEPPAERGEEIVTSQIIRASLDEVRLDEGRRDAVIQQAMRAALARPLHGPRRRTHVAPLLALAASLLLMIGALVLVFRGDPPAHQRHASVPQKRLSRSSNALMGRPFDDRAGASRRLDLVFADRMGGYRQLKLARGTP